MKSGTKYLDKVIHSEIFKIIKEQEDENKTDDEMLKTLDNMDTFVSDEKKQSDVAVKNSMKLMGTLSEPNKRNAENMNMKVQKDKIKKLDTMKKNVDDQKKNVETDIKLSKMKQSISNQPDTSSQITTQTSAITEHIKRIIKEMEAPIMRRTFAEQDLNSAQAPAQIQTPAPPQINTPSNKAYLVKFDKDTQRPFNVKFTERGFSVEGTRLSFEVLENALSKNYILTLNNGKGLLLDAIKMQKILKYKHKWFNETPNGQ